ncbi:Efflux ABC transporter, permease protein, partial [Arthrobacter sp. DR-2P]
ERDLHGCRRYRSRPRRRSSRRPRSRSPGAAHPAAGQVRGAGNAAQWRAADPCRGAAAAGACWPDGDTFPGRAGAQPHRRGSARNPRPLRHVHGLYRPGHRHRFRPALWRAPLPLHHAAGPRWADRRKGAFRPGGAVPAGCRGGHCWNGPGMAADGGWLGSRAPAPCAGGGSFYCPGPPGGRNRPAGGHPGHHQPALDPPGGLGRNRDSGGKAARRGPADRRILALGRTGRSPAGRLPARRAERRRHPHTGALDSYCRGSSNPLVQVEL